MRIFTAIAIVTLLSGCAKPTWPEQYFPAEVEVKQILFANSQFAFREGCTAVVAEITDRAGNSVRRFERRNGSVHPLPPDGWKSTPIEDEPRQYRFYESAFGGCTGAGGSPPGDLTGALMRPGAFYRVTHNGEAIAIIVPAAKLAGFFSFG
ncbi:hypothetical protein [Sphingobium algorifonticola]|uniref:Lipoprotein n=1 Tax=Sphingobium algorifonticola TaxID=2008318 RepID=A0A437J699_9SPHN|nr:hypothetical protein [Sphingobium algorifonticola]RVT40669.1 hypothetical protein ENE74_09275 [Sphingobium algorifonticola]